MAAKLVKAATSERLAETDWMKNIEICEIAAHDQRQAKDVVKAIKKRLASKNPNAQLYSVMLFEMLMNNIGDPIHKHVVDMGIIPILVNIVKKKSDLPARERIFLLLDATQTSLGGASGKFPQYYNAYYDLVIFVTMSPTRKMAFTILYSFYVIQSAGVKFPQRDRVVQSNHPSSQPTKISNVLNREWGSPREGVAQQAESETVSEYSVIQKASNALEVLKEVLDAVDTQHPEVARDEFTLDLVEQCSFQKQRLMQLVMTSRDEKIISQAIELNEKLHKVIARHDDLLSGGATATGNCFALEEPVEEEAEQLFLRLRKGKACVRAEDEDTAPQFPHLGLLGERLNRPLIRPLSLEPPPPREASPRSLPTTILPPHAKGVGREPPLVAIPPPPAKHVERERFFQEKKTDGSPLARHMRGLSLHSLNGSSSHSGSFDSSD